eukprot:TRINITY_DN3878_c0_g1_i3.p1 TRINITY_DN3878_c0_g1~~TRINITY_DN3878_c0_g1_i3.p1  ORF type:complete len:308 (+),score=64.88 TRINITY_DN3878_c0_g1_i3:28-951(+)
MSEKKQVTYWDYLKLDKLLSLQSGVWDESNADNVSVDELHFIIVHQTFELWFKLILAELRLSKDKLSTSYVPEETVPYVVHHLNRVTEIFRAATHNWQVMETLAPQDFLEFRSGLGTASGFQSFQMREMETLLGLDEAQRMQHGHRDPVKILTEFSDKDPASLYITERLQKAKEAGSLRDALHNWLYRTPIHGSFPDNPEDDKNIDAFLEGYIKNQEKAAEEHIQQVLADQGNAQEAILRQRYEVGNKYGRDFLYGVDVPEQERARTKRMRAAVLFIESYRDLPLLAWPRLLLDKVAELEEKLVLFR